MKRKILLILSFMIVILLSLPTMSGVVLNIDTKKATPTSNAAILAQTSLLWIGTGGVYETHAAPVIVDLNHDGYDDIVTKNEERVVQVLYGNNGSVMWSYDNKYELSIYGSAAIGNLNEDLILDIVIVTNNGTVLALNGTSGTILWFTKIGAASPIKNYFTTPSIADIDNDGNDEVFVSSGNNTLYCLHGENGTKIWSQVTPYFSRGPPAIADINDDGVLDVVIALDPTPTLTTSYVYAFNSENGNYLWSASIAGGAFVGVSIADVNQDQKLDIITPMQPGPLSVFHGENGTLLWEYSITVDSIPVVGDLDGDAKPEVVVTERSGRGTHCINGEDGSLLWQSSDSIGTPTLADVQGDNQLDVLISAGGLIALEGKNGNAIWQTEDFTAWSSPVVGNFDDDSNLEVLITGLNYNVYAYDITEAGERVYWQAETGKIGFKRSNAQSAFDTDLDLLSDNTEISMGLNESFYDTDYDALPDSWEVYHGLNPLTDDASDDFDFDTLMNYEEWILMTSPSLNDTDSDTMLDPFEVSFGLNPLVDDSLDDLDNDTMTNILEYTVGTFPNNTDSDRDFMPDGWEYYQSLNPLIDDASDDFDIDALINLQEFYHNTKPNDADSDDDLMTDGWEVFNSLNPNFDDSNLDPDLDQLTNVEEFDLGTNPQDSDSDSDSMPDGWEVENTLNPLHDDSSNDPDKDELTNIEEYNFNTDPWDSDSDDDLLNDGYEVEIGTEPTSADSDSDQLSDGYEVLTSFTNPLSSDSDNDSLDDAEEIFVYNTNPLSSDSDGDLLSDLDELFTYSTNPLNPDSDNDTISDYDEILVYGSNPLLIDSDGDGMSDPEEIAIGRDPAHVDVPGGDADGDGLFDADEYIAGTNPLDADTDDDYLPDGWEVVRGLDPLTYTTSTGEAIERIVIILGLACGLFALGFALMKKLIPGRETKWARKLNAKPLFLPTLLFLVVISASFPFGVMGPIDPGPRSVLSHDEFEMPDSPYFTGNVRVWVSYYMEKVETAIVTVKVYEDGQYLWEQTFTIASTSPFQKDESGSTTVYLEPGNYSIGVSISLSRSIRYSITLEHVDGRNDDQKIWDTARVPLLMISIIFLSAGYLKGPSYIKLKTSTDDDYPGPNPAGGPGGRNPG